MLIVGRQLDKLTSLRYVMCRELQIFIKTHRHGIVEIHVHWQRKVTFDSSCPMHKSVTDTIANLDYYSYTPTFCACSSYEIVLTNYMAKHIRGSLKDVLVFPYWTTSGLWPCKRQNPALPLWIKDLFGLKLQFHTFIEWQWRPLYLVSKVPLYLVLEVFLVHVMCER